MNRFTIRICDVGRYAIGTIDADGDFVEHDIVTSLEAAIRCIAAERPDRPEVLGKRAAASVWGGAARDPDARGHWPGAPL
jgi:hypothetical protein